MGSRTVLNAFKGGARRFTFLRNTKKGRKAVHFSEEQKMFVSSLIGTKTFFAPQKSEPPCTPFFVLLRKVNRLAPLFWLLRKVNHLAPPLKKICFSEKGTTLRPL